MRTKAMLALMFVSLMFVAAACGNDSEDGASSSPTIPAQRTAVASPQSGLPVIDLSYPGGVLHVEVASTMAERSKGLGGRESMAEDAGMLFDLGATRIPTFSMRDTLIPLDFIWIGEDRRVAGIVADVQPVPPGEPLLPYSPDVAVRYVLEVNGGTAERLNIGEGDQLEFELP